MIVPGNSVAIEYRNRKTGYKSVTYHNIAKFEDDELMFAEIKEKMIMDMKTDLNLLTPVL